MAKARCPKCHKRIKWKANPYRPFCSERCKLIDLGKWIDGEYRVKGEEPADSTSLKENVIELPIKKTPS